MTKKPVSGAADRLAKLLESWKVVVLAVAALVLLGVRFETWQSNIAHADDVSALSARVGVVESGMRDLKADLRLIREQLFEIARATGAKEVAPNPRGPTP